MLYIVERRIHRKDIDIESILINTMPYRFNSDHTFYQFLGFFQTFERFMNRDKYPFWINYKQTPAESISYARVFPLLVTGTVSRKMSKDSDVLPSNPFETLPESVEPKPSTSGWNGKSNQADKFPNDNDSLTHVSRRLSAPGELNSLKGEKVKFSYLIAHII